jgi:hypothetical protein
VHGTTCRMVDRTVAVGTIVMVVALLLTADLVERTRAAVRARLVRPLARTRVPADIWLRPAGPAVQPVPVRESGLDMGRDDDEIAIETLALWAERLR